MALTRKLLSAMGVEEEKIDQIINAHAETVNALKEERDQFKVKADALPDVQKELDDLKASSGGDGFEDKFNTLHDEYEQYKSKVEAEKTTEEKRKLYSDLLKESGVDEKRIGAILKVTDMGSIEVKDGKISDADKVTDAIKDSWKDFIVESGKAGAQVETPPASSGGDDDLDKLSDADYYKKVMSKEK